MQVSPPPSVMEQHQDFFGNTIHNFMIEQPHKELEIKSELVVHKFQSHLPEKNQTWEEARSIIIERNNLADLDAQKYLYPSAYVKLTSDLKNYALYSFTKGKPYLEALLDLTARIFHEFTYRKGVTTIHSQLDEILHQKTGVCQDFAHLQIGCLRSLGLPARYVSGYIETFPAPGKPKLMGADASHAWISAYVPDYGWLDLDPTNNTPAGKSHITVAWGRDYGDVTPAKGVIWGGGEHQLTVSVDVSPFKE